MQVPIAVSIGGGVAPAVLAAPAVAVLLRLSIACYLQLPLAAVLVTGIVSTDSTLPPLTLSRDDPANSQTAFCAQVAAAGNGGLRALNGFPAFLPRRAQAAAKPTTTVTLVSVACSAAGAGAGGVPAGLQVRAKGACLGELMVWSIF